MAGLLAVASSGCEDWKHVLDGVDLPDTGGGTKPGTMTGAAGASGASVKCDATMGPKGESCKTCWDASGIVVHQECAGPISTGTAGFDGTTPQACTKLEDGGPGSCKDAATWKRYGSDACNAQTLLLTDYALERPATAATSRSRCLLWSVEYDATAAAPVWDVHQDAARRRDQLQGRGHLEAVRV